MNDERCWDPGLQPERTALAWERTGLSLLGCSVALAAVDKQFNHVVWLLPTLAVLLLSLWVVVFGRRRYRDAHRALCAGRTPSLPDGRLVALTALAGLALGGVALASWLSQR